MQEKHVEIETVDGRMGTFVTHPDAEGPFPAVLLYMDAPGIREELYDFARRIGTVGYYCLVPDLYYRQGKIRFDRDRMTPEDRDSMFAAMATLDNATIMEDTRVLIQFMDDETRVDPGPKGTIGYCMGGPFVLSAAGTFPGIFRANASLHGVRNITEAPDSPHLLARDFRGELYLGFAENDEYVPRDEVEALREILASCEVEHVVEIHPGTEHGYSFPQREQFVKEAAERNWERIFAMFHRQIPTYA